MTAKPTYEELERRVQELEKKLNETRALPEEIMIYMSEGFILTDTKATPAKAVEKAKNHSCAIDLLMTDVVMPEMNGRDLAGQITAFYPDIRRLFTSGYTANVIAHHGILDDGVAFIQKPFSMQDMTAKVRKVLDTAPNRSLGQ